MSESAFFSFSLSFYLLEQWASGASSSTFISAEGQDVPPLAGSGGPTESPPFSLASSNRSWGGHSTISFPFRRNIYNLFSYSRKDKAPLGQWQDFRPVTFSFVPRRAESRPHRHPLPSSSGVVKEENKSIFPGQLRSKSSTLPLLFPFYRGKGGRCSIPFPSTHLLA